MSLAVGSILTLALGAGALLAAVLVTPEHHALAVHGYLLLIAAVALYSVTVGLTGGVPELPPPDRRRRRSRGRWPLPAELARIQDSLVMSTFSASELHYRFGPRLREIAADRLVAHGISLDKDPERARAALGEDAWALLRPDLDPPEDRLGPGLSLRALSRIVTAVEEL